MTCRWRLTDLNCLSANKLAESNRLEQEHNDLIIYVLNGCLDIKEYYRNNINAGCMVMPFPNWKL